jgi:hypothetical protein
MPTPFLACAVASSCFLLRHQPLTARHLRNQGAWSTSPAPYLDYYVLLRASCATPSFVPTAARHGHGQTATAAKLWMTCSAPLKPLDVRVAAECCHD